MLQFNQSIGLVWRLAGVLLVLVWFFILTWEACVQQARHFLQLTRFWKFLCRLRETVHSPSFEYSRETGQSPEQSVVGDAVLSRRSG